MNVSEDDAAGAAYGAYGTGGSVHDRDGGGGGRMLHLADRVDAALVLAVLVIDVLLLAAIEMTFVTLAVGVTPVPLSSLVALISTPWLVRRAGDLPAGAFAAGLILGCWTITIGVLGLAGPGGDVLLPDGWPSLLLVAAGLFPGALAFGRVIRSRRVAGA